MNQKSRRDKRYTPVRGSSFVQFDDPTGTGQRISAIMTEISVAGLAFQLEESQAAFDGKTLMGSAISLGDCEVQGNLAVRYTRQVDETLIEVGCLFYPETNIGQGRLMAAISGLSAAFED